MSLLIFYRRVFEASPRRFRIALYTVGGYITAWTIATFIVFVCRCTPISFFWYRSYGLVGLKPPISGTCLPINTQQTVPSVLNTLSDILILVLPGIALWPLQMRKSKKFGLFFVFSLGTFVCGISIVKIYYALAVNNSTDSTWINTEIQLWTTMECCIGLVCACLPCIMPLFRLFTRGFHGTGERSRSIQMKDTNPPRFPGGRRLHSVVELSETVHGSIDVTNTEYDKDTTAPSIPVGGEVLPWDKHGKYKSKIRNEAIGYTRDDVTMDMPPNTIKIENGWDVHSERRES